MNLSLHAEARGPLFATSSRPPQPELALMGSANAIRTDHSNAKVEKAPGGVTSLLQGLGGYTRQVRSRAPTGTSENKPIPMEQA